MLPHQRGRRTQVARGAELDADLLRVAKRHRLLRRQIGAAARPRPRTRCAALRHALGVRPVYKTVDTCAAEFAALTPYHYSTYDEETEVEPRDHAGGAHPRQRAQPHRPGHRVRLLVRARRAHAARGRLRDRHGQLQPRDGLDRLRHLRPPVLRAAHARGRARGRATPSSRPARSPASSCSSAGRPRSGWRSGSRTPACRSSAPAPRRSTWPRSAAPSAGCWPRPGCPRPKHGTATTFDEAQAIADRRSATRCSCARRTCSAVAAWRSSTTTRCSRDYIERATQISPEHPVLVDRFLDDAVEIDVDALYDGDELYLGGVMEHIEEAGIHSGDSACALPPITLGPRDIDRIRASTEAIAARRRRARPAQRPVRDGRRHPLRARGQPARLAHRAVRVEGHGGAAGQGRGARDDGRDHRRAARRGRAARPRATAARCRIGAPIAVKEAVLPVRPLPRRRHRARPGDALDRRGHGHRRTRSAPRSRSRRPRRTPAAADAAAARSSRWPTATSASMIFPVKRLADLGFEILRDRGHRRGAAPQRRRRRRCVRKHTRAADRTASRPPSTRSWPATSTSSSTRRTASGARLDGYEIRTAAVTRGVPCITTVQGLGRGGAGHRGAASRARSACGPCRSTPPIAARGCATESGQPT